MPPRGSNNPKRRIARLDRLTPEQRTELARRLVYSGSAHHKRHPGDFGFHPPVNPRPWKSMCDEGRVINKEEAERLFHRGIMHGMFSDFPDGGQPKYVWGVDEYGEPYEAKIGQDGYHGYRLEDDDDMRTLVLKEWRQRAG